MPFDLEILPGGENFFYLEDVCKIAPHLQQTYAKKVDLVYLDPPLYNGQTRPIRQKVGGAGRQGRRGYALELEDHWGNYKDVENYDRLILTMLETAYVLLKRTGSLYVHAETSQVGRLRRLCDEVFGADYLINEIVWGYKGGGRAKNFYSHRHDTLLFYRKQGRPYFNPDAIGMPRGDARRNNMKRGVEEDGRVYYAIRTGGKEYRYYEDSLVYPGDVWTDISSLQQKDPERTGYPQQKPEALLERIVRASCPKGGLVADLCCGSGTVPAVAVREGCRFLAVDINPISLLHTHTRMLEVGAGMKATGIRKAFGTGKLSYAVRIGSQHLTVLPTGYTLGNEENPFCNADDGHAAQITFENFACQPEKLGDLSLLECVAVGYEQDGAFVAQDRITRTTKQPYLDGVLTLKRQNTTPWIVAIDVFGNWSAERIEEL